MLLFFLFMASAEATAQSGKERREAAEKKAAEERLRSPSIQRTDNELKDDRNQIRPMDNDAKGDSAQANRPLGTVENSSGLADSESEPDSADNESNVPAVIQITTSESGSPGQLSENNGRGRDGTGNVQRATPNMAGSPVPSNLGLSEENQGQRNQNTNTDVLEQEEQPQQSGADRSEAEANSEAQKENGQRVKEDSKDKEEGDRKSRRKARRTRDKDSGR